jgi:hypothetical protein
MYHELVPIDDEAASQSVTLESDRPTLLRFA